MSGHCQSLVIGPASTALWNRLKELDQMLNLGEQATLSAKLLERVAHIEVRAI